MRIGVLARRAGMTPSRVRFYEAQGLLPEPPRRASGYRDYGDDALAALSIINRGKRLGYTLKDIASYLSTPGEDGRRSMLLRCVESKLTEFDALLTDTQIRRSSLEQLKRQLG